MDSPEAAEETQEAQQERTILQEEMKEEGSQEVDQVEERYLYSHSFMFLKIGL